MKENWRKNSNIYLPVLFKNWFFWDFNAPFDTNLSSLNWHLKGLFSSWTDSLGDLNAPFLKMLPQKIWKWMAYFLHELIQYGISMLSLWKNISIQNWHLRGLFFSWTDSCSIALAENLPSSIYWRSSGHLESGYQRSWIVPEIRKEKNMVLGPPAI